MRRLVSVVVGVMMLAALAGCGATATPTTGRTAAPSASAAGGGSVATPSRAAGPLKKVTMALGYIPDVQFAPFYVARERGFFRDEGLEVEFVQGFGTDVLKLVGTGALPFGVAGGDEVLIARSQGIPLSYVATWFQKYPIAVVALEGANIQKPEDLKGRTIGIPGRYGATYVGLRALLDSVGLKETDVQIREIGFTQVQALTQKQVEAVVGYANNEPVQLRAMGEKITTINVFDRVDLVSNGIITDEKTLKENPELVRSVVRAVLRGVEATIANPDEAVTLSIPTIPGSAAKRDSLRAILDATLPLFNSSRSGSQGLGYAYPLAWTGSRDLLKKLGFLGGDVDVEKVYTNDYLPKK